MLMLGSVSGFGHVRLVRRRMYRAVFRETGPQPQNLILAATGEGDLCSQASIDCWAKMPAIAPCHDAVVTEGKRGLVRSPAA